MRTRSNPIAVASRAASGAAVFAPPLAAVAALVAFARWQTPAAAPAETAYLTLLAGALLLCLAGLAEPAAGGRRLAVVSTLAVLVVLGLPEGPTRGAALTSLLAAALAVTALSRWRRTAAGAGDWTAALLPVCVALQVLLRSDRLLTPELDLRFVAGWVVLPTAAAAAVALLVVRRGRAAALLAGGTAVVAAADLGSVPVAMLVALAAAEVAWRPASGPRVAPAGLRARTATAGAGWAARFCALSPGRSRLERLGALLVLVAVLLALAWWKGPLVAALALLAALALAERRAARVAVIAAGLALAVLGPELLGVTAAVADRLSSGPAGGWIGSWPGVADGVATAGGWQPARQVLALAAVLLPSVVWTLRLRPAGGPEPTARSSRPAPSAGGRDRPSRADAVADGGVDGLFRLAAALTLALAAARCAPGSAAAAGPLALLALGWSGRLGRHTALDLQLVWTGALVLLVPLAAAYPWLHADPLGDALALFALRLDGGGAARALLAALAIPAIAGWLARRLPAIPSPAPHRADGPAADPPPAGGASAAWPLRPAVVAALALLALAACAALPWTTVTLVPAGDVALSAARPRLTLSLPPSPPGRSRPVRSVVVDSNLAHAAGLPAGTPVATVRLSGLAPGDDQRWRLIAGSDTAEWAARRRDVIAQRGAPPPPWQVRVAPEGGFFGQIYRHRHRLAHSLEPLRLVIELAPGLPPESELHLLAVEGRR